MGLGYYMKRPHLALKLPLFKYSATLEAFMSPRNLEVPLIS